MMAALATNSDSRAGQSGQGVGFLSTPVTLTLPMPPSVNEAWFNKPKKGRVCTPVYEDWKAYALTSIRDQHPRPTFGSVLVVLGFELKAATADCDNRVKPTLDILVKAKLIDDDRYIVGFAAAKLPFVNGLAHVLIMPAQSLALKFHPSGHGASGGWYPIAPPQHGEEHGSLIG